MGHSARAKFKREIRQQRLVTVIETQKDKRKQVAIQLALERAAAQPKTTGSNLRSKSRSIHQNVGPVTRSETGIPAWSSGNENGGNAIGSGKVERARACT